MTRRLLIVALSCAWLSAGCFEFLNQTTKPDPTVNLLGGQWISATPDASSLINSCTNFVWNVTDSTPTNVSGTFTATCFSVLQVSGSAQGTINGSTINWTASAIADGSGVSNCAITLQGTATIGANDIQIPYTGTTCMGDVSGTEVLQKQ